MLSYLKMLPGELFRLVMATLSAAAINLLLFYAGWYAWELYNHTLTGSHFARLHPERHQWITGIVALTPYWQSALFLAMAAAAGTLAVAVILQLPGLRRLLFDSLPLPLKGVWAVGLSALLAFPVAAYDARLGSWEAYACLLLPGVLCVLFPVMRAGGRLVPDLSMLLMELGKTKRH